MSKYVYVVSMGGLYRFSEAGYQAFLKEMAEGNRPEPDDMAIAFMGPVVNVTDMTPEEAKAALKNGY